MRLSRSGKSGRRNYYGRVGTLIEWTKKDLICCIPRKRKTLWMTFLRMPMEVESTGTVSLGGNVGPSLRRLTNTIECMKNLCQTMTQDRDYSHVALELDKFFLCHFLCLFFTVRS